MKNFWFLFILILVLFLIYFNLNNLLSFSGSTTYRGRGGSSSYRGSGERSGRGRGATRGGRGGYSSSTGRGSTSRDGGRFNKEKSPDGKVGRTYAAIIVHYRLQNWGVGDSIIMLWLAFHLCSSNTKRAVDEWDFRLWIGNR